MRSMWLFSGWFAAAVLGVAVVFRLADASEPAASGEEVPAAAARTRGGYDAPQPPEADAVASASPVASEVRCPGNDWRPSESVGDVEGIYQFLANAMPQDRELGRRILEARGANDAKALLAVAREARNCPEPRVRAMAVEALKALSVKKAPEVLDALVDFFTDENDHVVSEAYGGFASKLDHAVYYGDLDPCVVVEKSAEAFKAIDFERGVDISRMMRVMGRLGSRCLNPAAFDKSAEAFKELAHSGAGKVAEIGKKALQHVAFGRVNVDGNGEVAYDEAAVEQALSERRAEVEEALSFFPADKDDAEEFLQDARRLKAQAKERFGDDAESAAKWLAEEKAFLAKEIAD